VISKTYGKAIPITKVSSIFPFKINYFGIYQKLLILLSSLNTKDVHIIISTNKVTLPTNISNNVPVMLYLQFPPTLMTTPEYVSNKYNKSLFWRVYFKLYQTFSTMLIKKALLKSKMLLTNSQFTRDAIIKSFLPI
jgi:hypothetical protein